ncbi:cytochrome P450, partial [Coniella lustricola]
MASLASLASHVPGAIAWSLAALAVYTLTTFLYNVFLHPLRHIPGPLSYRGSRLPRTLRIFHRRWTRDILDLAKEYGPVVRVAPNTLVYTTPEAWKDIYGHGHQNGAVVKGEEFAKDPHFYRARAVAPNILGESRDNHALLRRQLAHGFSEKALREQEAIIMGYIDMFINGLRDRCVAKRDTTNDEKSATTKTTKTSFDMRHWFNYVTFDIIGDMAMGEPFGCLEKGDLDERVAFFEKGIETAPIAYTVKDLGLERYMSWLARTVFRFRKMARLNMAAVLRRRMDLNMGRPDLIEGLLKKQDDW